MTPCLRGVLLVLVVASSRCISKAARATDLSTLDQTLSRLPEGAKGYLRQTAQVRAGAAEIARLQHSPLWPKDSPERPAFAADVWGENGIDKIHAEAEGWPALVQLIAETAVDFLNQEGRRSMDGELFQRVLRDAIVKGDTVLSQLMRLESTLPGEWDYISRFRNRDEQAPPQDELVYRSLRRRQVILEENGMWRLRVPLMALWLRERG